MIKNKKYISVMMIILNIFSALFYAVYAFTDIQGNVSNIASAITFLLIIVNFIYAAHFKTKSSIVQIILNAFLFIINFASNYLAGISVYTLDKNYIGIISIILLFVMNALFFISYCKKAEKQIEINKTAPLILTAAGILFLLSIVIVAFISLLAETPINSNTVNLSLLLIVLCSAVYALICVLTGGFHSNLTKDFACGMFIFAIVSLCVLQSGVKDDILNANAEFHDIDIISEDNMRKIPYSLADEFVGIETAGFEIKRDVVYYSSDEGLDNGLTLRYDMYLPENQNGSSSVLVNIHGSGGDKDIGNYAHRNKYFASRGYIVFDLQIGDWNEKNTGFQADMRTAENMLFHIDKFFEYLSLNNDMNADLSSVFITGVSMGGTLASKYAYSYDNNLDEYGIELRAIIPVYPGYSPDDEGIDNYLNYVDSDSVPAMIVMGTSDCIVRTETVEETQDAYHNADNPNCFALEISYGGHGSDSLMTGRFNQLVMYYAERFMAQYK